MRMSGTKPIKNTMRKKAVKAPLAQTKKPVMGKKC